MHNNISDTTKHIENKILVHNKISDKAKHTENKILLHDNILDKTKHTENKIEDSLSAIQSKKSYYLY